MKKLLIGLILLVSMFIAFTSCEPITAPDEPDVDGIVYVRNSLYHNGGVDIDIYVDGRYKGKASYGSRKSFTLPDNNYHDLYIESSSYETFGYLATARIRCGKNAQLNLQVNENGIFQE